MRSFTCAPTALKETRSGRRQYSGTVAEYRGVPPAVSSLRFLLLCLCRTLSPQTHVTVGFCELNAATQNSTAAAQTLLI
jgi:hypothetical protein